MCLDCGHCLGCVVVTVILVFCFGRTVLECKTKQPTRMGMACVCVRLDMHMQMCECMDSVKHIYSEATLPAGHYPVPLCTNCIASAGLQKHCNFVVTIITSCYASPDDTSLLDPSQSGPTHYECAYGL